MIITENGKRNPRDFYPTPIDFCRVALAYNQPWIVDSPGFLTVLDAGAGTGNWGTALRELMPNAHLIGVDIQGEKPAAYDEWHIVPFETWIAETSQTFDLVIGNPPYGNDAPERWLKTLWPHLTPKALHRFPGRIFWLLRLAWYSSQGRYRRLFNGKYHPAAVYQSASRLSFTGDGKSDDTDYAMFLWIRGEFEGTHRRPLYAHLSMFDYKAILRQQPSLMEIDDE
jgi:hypothetical protein